MPISLVSESATKDGLPRYAFAYAPAEDPSTWRLPYLTADGAPDADALPRALTALVEGRVPMQALPSVKAKLRQAYRRTGVADNDLPDAIRESDMDIALMEYDPGQPRDYHGRWTDSGAGSGDPAPGDSRTGYAPNQIGHDISTPEKRALYDDMMAADRERWLQTAPERLQWNDVRDEYLSAGESLIADFTKRRRDIRSLSVGEVRAMIYAYERRGNAPAIHFWNDALAMKTGQTPSRPIGALLGGSTPPSRMPRSGMSPFQTADKARRQARQQRFGESDQPSYLADMIEGYDPSEARDYHGRWEDSGGGQRRTVKGPGRWSKNDRGVMHDDNGYPIHSAPLMTAEGYPIPGTGYPPARGVDIKTHDWRAVSDARQQAAAAAGIRDTSTSALWQIARNDSHPQKMAAIAELQRRGELQKGANKFVFGPVPHRESDFAEHGDPSMPDYAAKYHPGPGGAASADGKHDLSNKASYQQLADAHKSATPLPDEHRPGWLADDAQLKALQWSDKWYGGRPTVRPLGPHDAGWRGDQVATEGINGLVYQRNYGNGDTPIGPWQIVYTTSFGRTSGIGRDTWMEYTGVNEGPYQYGGFQYNLPVTKRVSDALDGLINHVKGTSIKESAEPSYLTGLLAGELGIPQYVIEALVDTDFEEKGGNTGHHFYGAWWGAKGAGARSGGTPAGHTHMFDEHPIGSWGQPASDADQRDPVALVRGYKSLKNAAQSDLEVAAATLAKSASGDDHALLADIQTELKRRNLVTGDALGMMDAWGGMHYAESDVREHFDPSEARDYHGRWTDSSITNAARDPDYFGHPNYYDAHPEARAQFRDPTLDPDYYGHPNYYDTHPEARDQVLGHSIDDQPPANNPHGFVKIPSSVRRKFEADVHAAPDDLLFTRSNGVPVTMASALTALRHPIISTPRERAEITRAIAAVYGLKS